MAATGKLDEKLEGLGFDEEDRTNMTGLTVAMMMRAASGDEQAFRSLLSKKTGKKWRSVQVREGFIQSMRKRMRAGQSGG